MYLQKLQELHVKLRKWGSDLTVLGFNSGSFELDVMLPYWPLCCPKPESEDQELNTLREELIDDEDLEATMNAYIKKHGKANKNKNVKKEGEGWNVIRKGSSYLSVSTPDGLPIFGCHELPSPRCFICKVPLPNENIRLVALL